MTRPENKVANVRPDRVWVDGIRNASPEVIRTDETRWSMQGLLDAESVFSRFQFRRLERHSKARGEFVYLSIRGWE
jgi:hypothetical protein